KNVELKEKNEQLQKTLRQLHAAQAQLIQTGKMAALGNLVAGIIHEINNPVGSIISGADISEKVVSRVIDELNILKNNATVKGEIKRLLEILQQVVQTTQRGAERIATIMESLKNFSKIDSSKFQKINIHTGIDSALTLMNHEITQKIEVKKHYGSIPEIFCNPSELNQVFMNILMNSVHAIENNGTITIRTGIVREQVQIRISDNGKGIPPEKIDTLFDPGFISKNSNIRMRTGLFSSSNIIRKHGGQIQVKSEVGKGTTFIILLPVKQPETQPVVESK
ncbi:MAG: sensor histidine kinase, partial [Calditrichia bacterium]